MPLPILPKSSFWAPILKLHPKLKAHSFYQITQGDISLWSTPWCPVWTHIYNHLNIQPVNFVYPALVKDIWIAEQKSWNIPLINCCSRSPHPLLLFKPMLFTPIALTFCVGTSLLLENVVLKVVISFACRISKVNQTILPDKYCCWLKIC